MRYLELCREMGISPASQILKYLESEAMHVVHYGGWPTGRAAWVAGCKNTQHASEHDGLACGCEDGVRRGGTYAAGPPASHGRMQWKGGTHTAWVPGVRAVPCTPATLRTQRLHVTTAAGCLLA